MQRDTTWLRAAVAAMTLAVLCLAGAVAGAAEAEADGDQVRRVEVIEIGDCDEAEGDCVASAGAHHMVFVSEDGETHEVEGDVQWVGEGGAAAGEQHMVFIGEDGEAHALGSGVHWVGEGGEQAPMIVHFGASGPRLGVGLTELTPELRTHFGVPEDAGVMVSKVVEGSAAWNAGLQAGDIVSSVDGETVASSGALARAIRGREAGDVVTLGRWRDGGFDTLSATLDEGESAERLHRRIVVRCEEGEECGTGDLGFDCGGAEECQVRVICRDGNCDCTVNDETVDCATIPHAGEHGGFSFHHHGDD